MKFFVALLCFFWAFNLSAQTDYYSTNGKNRFTKTELDAYVLNTKEKMTKAFEKEMFVYANETRLEEKQDSIIHFLGIDIRESERVEQKSFKGEKMPNFDFIDMDGQPFSMESLEGKPTLVNFWFAECPPCIDEMPVLNGIYEKYKEEFNFIAITYEPKTKVKKFLKKYPFKFTHVVEAQSFIDQLGISSFPKNFLLDQDGIIRHIENGIPYTMTEDKKLVMGDGKEFIERLEAMKK